MKEKNSSPYKKISSRAVHEGEKRIWQSVTTPTAFTSTYFFRNMQEVKDFSAGNIHHYEYGRYNNPTRETAECKLASLEGGERCLLFDSGMSAVSAFILGHVSRGDHIVVTDDVYRQTSQFIEAVLPRFGVDATIVPVTDYEAMEKAIRPDTGLVISESPTNPYLNIVDFTAMAAIGKKHNVLVMIDSTFGTPCFQRPLEYGIDAVIHSATKYLGGHNDLLAGAVIGSKEVIEPVFQFQRITGGIPDPHTCYLLIRGLKTLEVRMTRLNETGMKVAQFLSDHPKVRRIYYPGLESHQQYKLARKQMQGFGAVVTFELKGNLQDTEKFLDALQMCLLAPSFGGPETLVTHPASMSYYSVPREERIQLGILDELVRISVGLEDPVDIIADLNRAFSALG